MQQDRWDRVSALFWDALERDPASRAEFVASHGTDAATRDEVIAMLAAHDEGASLRVERRFISRDTDEEGGLAPGTRLGPFRVLALIGRGGMGEVYRAERADGEFEQVVAIKLLRPDAQSTDIVRRFRAERALLARLSHPNIASVLDGGTAADGRPYLVLRYIDGVPITRYAERLTVAGRLRVFLKVADAVQVAHSHLVVHRDIKPSNVLVGADGEPILLDFGIAKLLDNMASDADRTRTGRMLHTPSHAAPEQVRGEPVTTATDVYGLGALLFEMLSGTRLFGDSSSAAALERAILEDAVPLPSAATANDSSRRELRGDLDRIVQMALRKEPARRYASASDLAGDIRRHLSDRPVLAQPDRWSYRTARFVRRNRGLVVTGVLAVVAGAAVVARELAQARVIAGERDRALREQAAGEDAVAFVTDLFQQSDPRVVPGGDTLRVGAFLDRAEARAAALAAQPERQMRVYRVLGSARASRGDYADAESLLMLARDIGARQFGAEHIEVLRTERQLAKVLDQYHGEGAARSLLESVLQRLLRTGGPDHPDLAGVYSELAGSVFAPDSIRLLIDSAIAVRSRMKNADSIAIASLLDDQARERGTRGRFAEAVALEEASLRILRSRLPGNHPDLLAVKGNLSIWLSGMAQWQRSLALAEEALAVARSQVTAGQALALAHERVALLNANIPGGLPAAERGIRETLRIFRANVSPEHNLITSSMRNLAIVMAHQGRDGEGLVLLDSAIARNVAAGNADAAAYLRGQTVPMLVRLGRFTDALRNAEIAADSRARLPRGSTYVADLTYWLGFAQLANGRVDEAVRQLGAAHEDIDDNFPAQHPRKEQVRCAFGVALARAGRDEEARVHLAVACPRLDGWGLADPTIVTWGRRERQRLTPGSGASR